MSINLSNISGWAIFEAGYTADSTLPEKPLFRLLNFGVLEKDCINQVSFLLSMRFMLLRYSFEFRPNNHVLGTEDSVMIIGVSKKGC